MKNLRIIKILAAAIPILILASIAFAKINVKDAKAKSTELVNTVYDFRFEEEGAINYESLFQKNLPAIVNYGSEGCGPCRAFKPVIVELNKEMDGRAFIKYVDIWKYRGGQGDVPIYVIPTQVFFYRDGTPYKASDEEIRDLGITVRKGRDGKEYTIHEGGMKKDDLLKILEKMGAL